MAARPAPGRALCRHCGLPLQRFGRCRRRLCPGYRDLWAGDWRKVLVANLAPVEGVALITVTAPGTDAGLPWDRSFCTHPPDEPCSGKKGCRVLERAADRWHRDHARRWRELHRAAAARARRLAGAGPIVAAKVWEVQARGLDHLHLVVPYETPSERRRADAYVAALKALAPRYWFGFVDMKATPRERGGGVRAAVYVAKYVGKATREETSPHVRRPMHVGLYLLRRTGVTMRACRYARYLWVMERLRRHSEDQERAESDLTPSPLAALRGTFQSRGP